MEYIHVEFPQYPNTTNSSRDARDAIEAVFDALSKWRDEIGASTERYSETVLDKMADAARALGWPNELVDASHKHLVQASRAQMQTIDQLMDAWKKQLTAPEANQFMAQLRAFPTAGFGTLPVSLAPPPLDANSRDVAAQLAVGNVNVDFRFVAAALRRRPQKTPRPSVRGRSSTLASPIAERD